MFSGRDMQTMALGLAVLGSLFNRKDIEEVREARRCCEEAGITEQGIENTLLKLTMAVMEGHIESQRAEQEKPKRRMGISREDLEEALKGEKSSTEELEQIRDRFKSLFEES